MSMCDLVIKDQNTDLISIIVPCYNVEDYIDACVQSICDQTYSNLEIILVDDGATDATGKKCDEWLIKDGRIRVIHQENKGLSGARNAGIKASAGKYLAFIDSDDLIAPEYAKCLHDCIVENNVLMAQGRSNNFFKESDIESFSSTYDCSVMTGKDMCHILMSEYRKGWGIVMTKMFDRSLFDDLEFPEGRIHEDEYLVYRLLWEAGKIAVSDRIVYYYRSKRAGSITHAGYSLKRLDALDARKQRCSFFKEKGEAMLYEDALLSLAASEIDCARKLKASDIPDKDKYIKAIEQELRQNISEINKFKTIGIKKKASLWMEIHFPAVKEALFERK